jgi:acetyl esterase/lipase
MRTAPLLAVVSLAVVVTSSPAQERRRAPKMTDAPVQTAEVVYKKTPQGELKLHLYRPADWKASDKRPAIVFFFGGGWQNGSHLQFTSQAEYFASRGLVCATADYRVANQHHTTPDACIEDAKSALRYVRGHAAELGVDPDRLAAAGGSAGGHLAAAVAMVPGFDAAGETPSVSCKPNALILFNPALDVPGRPVKDASGQDVADRFWPNKFVAKDAPPAIIFFGTEDRLGAGGKEYLAKAKKLGARAELVMAAGQGHGFFNRAPYAQLTVREADRFLTSLGYLNGEPTVKVPANAPSLKREE